MIVGALALIALAVIARRLGPERYAGFAVASAAIAICAAALLQRFAAPRDARLEPMLLPWTALLHLYGAPLALTTFSFALLRWADRFVLAGYVDAGELGSYAAVVDLVQLVFAVLLGSLYGVWLPRLVRTHEAGDARSRNAAASRYAASAIALLLPTLTVVVLLRRDVLAAVFGSAYSAQAALLPWVALAVVLGLLRSFVLDVGLALVGRAGLVARNVLISAGVGFTLNVLFVPRHGIWAAVAAALVAQSTALVLALFSGRDVITWRIARVEFERIVFCCGLMVFVLFLLPRGSLLAVAGDIGAAATAYASAMLLVNGIGCRDWLLARLGLRSRRGNAAP